MNPGPPAIRSHRAKARKPRLGFLGVGWIGRHRLEAIAKSGVAKICAIADPSAEMVKSALALAPEAATASSLDELLESDLDGVVIATPSAAHAEQTIAALEKGLAVFCQKPLGRNGPETRRAIEAARAANRLLGVDLSYRFISGIQKIRNLCREGELGEIYAAELVFHNAYGPDKAWFYDWRLSGGGCLIDLGVHLVDLALWCLGFPRFTHVTSRLFAKGRPVEGRAGTVEDYAVARIDLETGATLQIACSWKLPAGSDAVIGGSFYGTKAGAGFNNVNGSFYDFAAERFLGTKRETLATAPEAWGGRAAVDWAERLAVSQEFDPEIESAGQVAEVLDRIYGNARAVDDSSFPATLPCPAVEVSKPNAKKETASAVPVS